MPNCRWLILTLPFLSASLHAQQAELRTLATSLASEIASSGRKAVAVVDFTDLQGNPTELGRFLAEEFAVALTRTHQPFEVIDRTHLKTILAEHKLASTGLIDPATAKKLGQIVGADVLLTGTMTPFSESVRVAVKVIAVDTARIIAADTTDLPRTKTISELLGAAGGNSGSGATESSRRPATPSSSAPSQSNPIVVVAEFSYELVGCKGTGGSVRCSLRITNIGSDRDLTHNCDPLIPGNSNMTRAFDNFGNESPGGQCSIGNRGQGLWGTSAHMISGVSVPASVLFEKISPSAATLSLITIRAATSTQYIMDVSFRNVPIMR